MLFRLVHFLEHIFQVNKGKHYYWLDETLDIHYVGYACLDCPKVTNIKIIHKGPLI